MTGHAATWWKEFFDHRFSLDLSQFPDADETQREVAGLISILELTSQQRIADVCCGYGRHLLPLAQQGHIVFGVDTAPMMLAKARQWLEKLGVPAVILRADARQLPFADDSLDVVLNLFNSFGYCQSEVDNQRILTESARVLRPGGKFLLETRNRPHQIMFAPHYLPMETTDGQRFILRCRYDRAAHRLISEWHQTEDGPVVHRASIRLYGIDELDEMMAEAGLRKTAIYGDYEATPFAGYQRQVLYLAEKPICR